MQGKQPRNFKLAELNPHKIRPMAQGQPRTYFDEQEMEELIASIRSLGQQQTIRVFPLEPGEDRKGNAFELIWGERRTEACRRLNISVRAEIIPRPFKVDALAMATVENCCRADISAYEKAIAYARLQKEMKCSEMELAQALGFSTPTVNRYLRLSRLHPEALALLHPKLGEREQLRVEVALELEKRSATDQERIAPLLVGLPLKKAEVIIADQATSGIKPTSRKRNPSDLRKLFTDYGARLHTDTERFLGMSRQEFAGYVVKMPTELVKDLARKFEKEAKRLEELARRLLLERGIEEDDTSPRAHVA